MQTDKSNTKLREATSIAWGGGAGLLGRVSSMVFGYFLALVMARGLGLEDYGLYVVGFSLVHLAGSVALLGLNRGIVRLIAVYRGTGDKSREWGAFLISVTIVTLTGLIAGTLVILLAHLLTNLFNAPVQFPRYLWGFACWIFLWALTYQIGAVAEAVKHAQDRFFIIDVCGPFFRLLLVGAVLIAGGRLLGVIWACVLAAFVTLLIMSWRVYHLFVRSLKDVHPVFPFRELMAFSIPVMLHNLLNVSRNQVEIYLLAVLQSAGASGVFNVASRTSLLVFAFLDGLGVVFSPFIADLVVRRQKAELQELMSTVTRWSLTASLPVSLAIITFSGPIVGLFGSDFGDAVPALVILAIAQLINTAFGPVETVITMSGRPALNLLNSILSVGLSLLLGLILIPRFGIVGAALSGGIALTSVNFLRAIQVFLVLRISCYNRKLLKPVFGVGIATFTTAVVLWLGHPMPDLSALGVGLPLFFLTYGGSLYFLGLEESDLTVLKNVWARAMRR